MSPDHDGNAEQAAVPVHRGVDRAVVENPDAPTVEAEAVEAGTPEQEPRGADLARAALQAARAAARKQGLAPRRTTTPAGTAGSRRRRWSAPGPDERDPQLLGAAVHRLIGDRGWETTAQVATVMGRWDALVGEEIARHCRPESLVDGTLVLVAESTAWATQLRLLERRVRDRLTAELGAGVVRQIRVHGPTAPSWARGPRRVAGRGPRDTYG